jgi:tripartite-type tricarboxylate transporter receptor subunit TctC
VRKTTYKPIDDFSFLGQLAYTPNVFVVPASLPAKNMKEFVALAKSNPGKFSYGMMPGVPHHLDFERFKKETGTDIVFVGYRGGTPIVNGLLGEEVQATLFNEPLFSAWVKAGKIRALATTAKTRTATMPDVPTLAEAGFPNLKLSEGSFYSLAAPAGMPKELGDKLFKAFSDAAATPETSKRLEAGGFEVKLLEGGALKQEIRREYTENEKIVKTLDIKLFD